MINLHPHQIKALGEIKNGSILKGGVGTGKSITAIAYYIKDCGGGFKANDRGGFAPMARARDLYIVTTAKKVKDKDWETEFHRFGLGSEPASNVYGRSVHVISWNKIQDYQDIEGAFFIFDEQRLVGRGAWVKAFLKIAKTNRWILLSATPGDTWMDYIPVFVANGYYRNRTEFLRRHVVFSNFTKFPKVDHYVEVGRLEAIRRRLLVEMPYTRHTTRHIRNIVVTYDKDAYDRVVKDRWHIYEDRPIKDVSELFIVMRKLVNSDISRLGAVMELLEKHDKLIVFYSFNYELEMLRTLSETLGITTREWNGHKHEAVPSDHDKWLYLVQYTAGAEGWNCIETDAMAFYSLQYSWKTFEQAQGRTDRLNTPYKDLYYYVIRSGASIDVAIMKALTFKQNFNEKSYGKQLWEEWIPF